MKAPLLGALALTLAAGLGACRDDDAGEPRTITATELGRGAAAVVVWRPARPRRPAVVFLHGWGAVDPRAYAPWIRHLARRGSPVILPRYQTSALSLPQEALPNAIRGVRSAFEMVDGPWVAAGHSAGGALAADLAARAREAGLRAPRAVYAANPGRGLAGVPFRIPSVDLGSIPAGTRVLAMAGARDRVTGQATARAIVDGARAVPPSRRRFVLVSRPDASDHLAPQRGDRAAREVFWPALDRLIDDVR